MRRAGLLVVATLIACGAGPGGANAGVDIRSDSACRGDTLRGIVAITGSEPGVQAILRAPGTERVTSLDGDLAMLRKLDGLEVVVAGTSSGSRFVVREFAIRAVQDLPAIDGTLLIEPNGRAVLDVGDGTPRVIAALPPGLRDAARTRIWLAGDLRRAPDSFGRLGAPAVTRTCAPTRTQR